jgi:hypothetical protein
MTPEQKQKAIDFLKSHITEGCPACKSRSWTIVGMVRAHEGITDDPSWTGAHRSIPLVLVGCNVCFLVTQYAAGPMGVLPPRLPPSPLTPR